MKASLPGFLQDVGVGHWLQLSDYDLGRTMRYTLAPALGLLTGQAFSHWEMDAEKGNILFFSLP